MLDFLNLSVFACCTLYFSTALVFILCVLSFSGKMSFKLLFFIDYHDTIDASMRDVRNNNETKEIDLEIYDVDYVDNAGK